MPESEEPLLSIDPGRSKWGIAVIERSGRCLHREVASNDLALARIRNLRAKFGATVLLLGDRTGSDAAGRRLEELSLPIRRISEHRTTLLARELYWRDRPPRGWRRLIPRGLLTPPEPLDGYAAEALALRYLGLLD
jgi:hypothetical protein